MWKIASKFILPKFKVGLTKIISDNWWEFFCNAKRPIFLKIVTKIHFMEFVFLFIWNNDTLFRKTEINS